MGYGLIQTGLVLAWWSSAAWVALLSYAPPAYATEVTEEASLLRLFSDEYRADCRRTPRFIGLPRRERRLQVTGD